MKHSELRHQPRHVNPRIQALCQIRIERKRIAELCGCYELVQLLVPICLY